MNVVDIEQEKFNIERKWKYRFIMHIEFIFFPLSSSSYIRGERVERLRCVPNNLIDGLFFFI